MITDYVKELKWKFKIALVIGKLHIMPNFTSISKFSYPIHLHVNVIWVSPSPAPPADSGWHRSVWSGTPASGTEWPNVGHYKRGFVSKFVWTVSTDQFNFYNLLHFIVEVQNPLVGSSERLNISNVDKIVLQKLNF